MTKRVVAAIAIAAFAGAGLVFLNYVQQSAKMSQPSQPSTLPSSLTTNPGSIPLSRSTSSLIAHDNSEPLVGNGKEWKTYRNQADGYEFDYPSDWVLEEQDHAIDLRESVYDAYGIYIDRYNPDGTINFTKHCQVIKFAATDAYYCNLVTGELGGAPSIFVPSIKESNALLEIQDSRSDDISRKILSSFKIL